MRGMAGRGGGWGAKSTLRLPPTLDPSPPLAPLAGGGEKAAAMIPITSFAGKTVALFGLGASGISSASALLAGGADVVAWDDTEASVEKARAAGIPVSDLRHIDWSRIAALVLAPGVPLTHPAPHWTVALGRNAAVEVVGDVGLVCRARLC